jgi:hypothetical protein
MVTVYNFVSRGKRPLQERERNSEGGKDGECVQGNVERESYFENSPNERSAST